jgi:hypothetical protein
MRHSTTTIALTMALALPAVPAFALPAQIPSNSGTAHVPDNQGTQRAPDNPGPPASPGKADPSAQSASPGPGASASSKAKAYGKYCADQSKKHVAGQKGTPFSLCVSAAAKLLRDREEPPSGE